VDSYRSLTRDPLMERMSPYFKSGELDNYSDEELLRCRSPKTKPEPLWRIPADRMKMRRETYRGELARYVARNALISCRNFGNAGLGKGTNRARAMSSASCPG
jgi:hypothetical protein